MVDKTPNEGNARIVDPIASLVASTKRLNSIEDREFPREWLLRALLVELQRYTMEDAHIDLSCTEFRDAAAAFKDLVANVDWLHPRLSRFLIAYREATRLPQLQSESKITKVRANGHAISVVSRSTKGAPFWVSNTSALRVPIMEDSLATSEYCAGLVKAFTYHIKKLQHELKITHLCFIEKEMGPIGAISMMAALVASTKLDACVYRETHWPRAVSLAGDRPTKNDRVAVIYDLVVSGAGICAAADVVKQVTEASTVAAVVLCGYGRKVRSKLSSEGQKIQIRALDWNSSVLGSPVAFLARDGHETRKSEHSESRGRSREEAKLDRDQSKQQRIPPGYYDQNSLPPISAAAEVIVESIRAATKRDKSKSARRAHSGGLLRLVSKGSSPIRLKRPTTNPNAIRLKRPTVPTK